MRALTGAIMIVAALLAAYVGGDVLALIVAAVAAAMFYDRTACGGECIPTTIYVRCGAS